MRYSKADITQWLLGALEVKSMKGNELNFPCPICEHESCYFNIQKQMGYCHKAACHETFTVDRLIDIIGHAPGLAGYVPALDTPMFVQLQELHLPKGAEPILRQHDAVHALYVRGVSWSLIKKFDIHQNKTHIIVPIYEEGELVQYNSRRINRNEDYDHWFTHLPKRAMKYKYAEGYPIANYFLGWDECRLWTRITLVENTFVSMWLRDLKCTATFGSHLSVTQVNKLVHSRIEHVTIIWDEGAEEAAQKAQRKLKAAGIPCTVVYIKGQPDDYSKEEIKELIKWDSIGSPST